MIVCNSIKGNKVLIPNEKLVFRPSVYAVIIKNDKILMLNTRSSGKYFFPGGGVNIDETTIDALKREVKEEVGIKIEVGKFIYFKEQFFYYDPLDEAYHMFNFFYLCTTLADKLIDDDKVDDEESEKPRWVDIGELKKFDTLEAVKEVLELI